MKIAILCSDATHPIYPYLQQWVGVQSVDHNVMLAQRKEELDGGDILFLISCHEIIRRNIRKLYKVSLVIHASNPPQGRGWSPHIWQILEGKNKIPLTLLEAEDAVDSGPIWTQTELNLEGHETSDEINHILFKSELELMDFAVKNIGKVVPRQQAQDFPTHYRKRVPEDSKLDPFRSIADQFDLIRVSDPNRFPAYFELRGHHYLLSIKKVSGYGHG